MRVTSILAIVLLLFASCARSTQSAATAGPASPQSPAADPAVVPQAAAVTAPVDASITYQPESDRVLRESDGESLGMEWKPLGMSFPAQLGDVRYGLLFADAPVLDAGGGSLGRTIPAGSRVTVLDAQPWVSLGTGFRRLYQVRWEADSVDGWISGGSLALITAEEGALSAGVVPRKIVAGGGDSEYSLLAVVSAGKLTLVDTSVFPFADAFHPSGVLRVSIEDANGDGKPEVVLEAETIVSLRYLGASSLRWTAWLQPRDGTWSPILLYNESFGTDAGYSYTTTMRALDTSGVGMLDMVRLDTEYVLVSGESEFRASTVSFYRWSGSTYKKAPLEDLPRRGTITAESAPLMNSAGPDSPVVGSLARGDALFVFDRSDTRQSPDDAASWWYRVVTKSGAEGWIGGTSVDLSWIDPLKENRPVFLGQATPP